MRSTRKKTFPSHTDLAAWKTENLAAINQRLAPLSATDKIEKIIQGDIQGLFLHKVDGVLMMYCYDNNSKKLSNIMSRIDLTTPLNLVGPYSQAVFLSAFWQIETPNNIYIAGFGGGRLAMLYDHHFPMANIHGSDIDPNVIEVAKEYFGLSDKVLKNIFAADSREDLASRDTQYDVIFLDVFVGGGEHVNHLATIECFELYKSKLTENGVIVANLVIIDERMEQKIAAMQAVFKHCHIWEYNGAYVVFASNHNIDLKELIARVDQFQSKEELTFNLVEKANMLKPCIRNIDIDALCDNDL